MISNRLIVYRTQLQRQQKWNLWYLKHTPLIFGVRNRAPSPITHSCNMHRMKKALTPTRVCWYLVPVHMDEIIVYHDAIHQTPKRKIFSLIPFATDADVLRYSSPCFTREHLSFEVNAFILILRATNTAWHARDGRLNDIEVSAKQHIPLVDSDALQSGHMSWAGQMSWASQIYAQNYLILKLISGISIPRTAWVWQFMGVQFKRVQTLISSRQYLNQFHYYRSSLKYGERFLRTFRHFIHSIRTYLNAWSILFLLRSRTFIRGRQN